MKARRPILLAGRRPDSSDSEVPRFPIENVVLVRERIRSLLAKRRPSALVCSGACGADLLALDIAGDLGIPRKVVLPFDVHTFRVKSVVDRPGSWGPLYDRVVGEVKEGGGLTVLQASPNNDGAYAETNQVLLRFALELGSPTIVLVWEGQSRGDGDLTQDLLTAARRADVEDDTILTM